jgi:hypothetical protein
MLKITYKEFVNAYPKMWHSSLFYPVLLKLKRKGFDFQKIKNILGDEVPESTLYFWFNNKRVPLPFKEFSKIKKEFDRDDSEKLATIVGHVLGDGGIDKKMMLHYCNTEEFLINEFQNAMKFVFDVKPMYKRQEESGIIRLVYPRLLSRILFCLFGRFSLGRDNKQITPEIEKMPMWWKIKLLQALYNDDGSVPKTGHCVAFKQKDKGIILWVQTTLKELGINSRLTPDETRWHLRITNYLDLVKFRDRVNFSKGYRKQIQLNKTIEQIKFPHWKTKYKIIKILKEGPKTRKELAAILHLKSGTVYGHLHGWKRTKRKSNLGLVDLRLVKVKKVGRINLYYI